jgi:hypothetical protein
MCLPSTTARAAISGPRVVGQGPGLFREARPDIVTDPAGYKAWAARQTAFYKKEIQDPIELAKAKSLMAPDLTDAAVKEAGAAVSRRKRSSSVLGSPPPSSVLGGGFTPKPKSILGG